LGPWYDSAPSWVRRKEVTMNEEGWFKDPYERHEARWVSDGTPTALVRDAGVESQDTPPDEPITVEMERVAAETIPGDGSDLKRADDAETQEFDPGALIDAAEEGIDSSR
jgi:hypothetical protein